MQQKIASMRYRTNDIDIKENSRDSSKERSLAQQQSYETNTKIQSKMDHHEKRQGNLLWEDFM